MVKGVHKKIIEINHPDSLYFEKAVFYLRPGMTEFPQGLAREAACDLLQNASPARGRRGCPLWVRYLLVMLLSGGLTALLCLLAR